MPTDVIDYRQLAHAMMAEAGTNGTRFKAVPSTPTGIPAHGPGGLFSQLGLDSKIFSAMQLPQQGLSGILPVMPTQYTDPLFGIITGVTATTGSNPSGVCDDFPVAGLLKLCTTSLPLGRYGRQTTVIDLDLAGKQINRGEFLDLQILGSPFDNDVGVVPTFPGGANFEGAARTEANKRLLELAVAWSRDFARQVYEGLPTNNLGDGYKEFNGLNALINTGYRDAVTGQACPAADSIIASFGNLDVASNGAQIVRLLAYIYRNLNKIAYEAGLGESKWAIAMPYGLFYELSEIWPCAYMTYRCSVATGSTNFVDADEQVRMRDDMRGDLSARTGQYLLIDGQHVPVVLDDAIREDGTGGGTQVSSIYFIPLTVLGGTRVTYWEYFNYNVTGGARDIARQFAPDHFFSSDDGRFMWTLEPPTKYCIRAAVKMEPRIVLRTPYLAARITNVRYTPLLMPRSPFTDSPYFVDGGNTNYGGYGPSYYRPTA